MASRPHDPRTAGDPTEVANVRPSLYFLRWPGQVQGKPRVGVSRAPGHFCWVWIVSVPLTLIARIDIAPPLGWIRLALTLWGAGNAPHREPLSRYSDSERSASRAASSVRLRAPS